MKGNLCFETLTSTRYRISPESVQGAIGSLNAPDAFVSPRTSSGLRIGSCCSATIQSSSKGLLGP